MIMSRSMFRVLRGLATKKNPVYVQVAVTKRCNLKCMMCNIINFWKDQKDMTLQDLEQVADVLRDLNTGIVVLTGGEPFLRDDLPDIVRIFKKRGLGTRLQTNGAACSEDDIRDVVKAGLDDVSISLDSLIPEKEDKITGIPGSWDKIMMSISMFSEFMPKRGNMPVINSVLSRLNIDEIKNIVVFSDRIGFYASIIPVHVRQSVDENLHFRSPDRSIGFPESEFSLVDSTYDDLVSMKQNGYNIYNSFRFLRESPGYIKYGLIRWKCRSPSLYFSVSPEGLFSPCIEMKTGTSLLDPGFTEIYRSRGFRKGIKKTVRSCSGCMYGCWPEITYLSEDFNVLFERVAEGAKIMLRKRDPVSYDDSIKIIRSII
jgi:MoaA/NifB/PqqE/SkfB family radical SAM enzyme